MKKDTFISIMDSIRIQYRRAEIFGEAIRDAFITAGESPDFRQGISYLPPTDKFVESIVDALATEISGDNISRDSVLDTLTWFMWDTNFGSEWELGIKEDHSSYKVLDQNQRMSSAWYIVTDASGVEAKLYCRDAGELWDAMMYEYGIDTTPKPNIVSASESLPSKVSDPEA